MTIRIRMFLTLFVVVSLLTAMAAVMYYQFDRFNELQQSQRLARQLSTNLLQLRREEKDFLSRKEMKYAEQFNAKFEEMERDFSSLTLSLANLSFDVTAISDNQHESEEYARVFNAIAKLQAEIGLDPESGLYGKLRDAVHNAEAILKEKSDSALLAHMLMLRRHEKDFMLRRATKYIDKFEQDLAILEQALAKADLSPGEIDRISRQLQRYQADFKTLAEAEKRIG